MGRLRLLVLAVLVGGIVALAVRHFGSEGSLPAEETPRPTAEERIRKLCSTCHALASPDILPRSAWQFEVDLMYELAGADPEIEDLPPKEQTLRYFQDGAPEVLAPSGSYARQGPGPLRFLEKRLPPPDGIPLPAISYLKYVPFLDDGRNDLIACDMRTGRVLLMQPYLPGQPVRTLAKLSHPAHVEVVDLDRDGLRDLLVAELGSFLPMDGDKGKVVWLRGRPDGTLEHVPLLENVGRVADVQAADFDGDGDLDLAVAVFGWRTTGKVVILTNTGERDDRGVPLFDDDVLDPRPGSINVPIVDLDRDGRLDIVGLVSQQFETVEAYLGDGDGWFERKTIFEAPHPDWGSCGIEVVDLDGDGDLDVVMVNGDTLDNPVVLKPHQGVYWLENEGRFPFRVQRLATLPGAMKVRAADLDGDGDLDLAVSSFLPQMRERGVGAVGVLDSVLWIEQTAPGRFKPHPLEAITCDHAALEVGDLDGDGDVDIAVGTFYQNEPGVEAVWLTLFTNAGG